MRTTPVMTTVPRRFVIYLTMRHYFCGLRCTHRIHGDHDASDIDARMASARRSTSQSWR